MRKLRRPWCASASRTRFGLDPVRDIQVLCPMNRGGLGARALNIELQQALNPPGESRVERFGWTFWPGRQGDAGRERLRPRRLQRRPRRGQPASTWRKASSIVAFDGREVTYGFGELDELVLAYATTIHKSQGSEYPAVVIPLTTQHYTMLARNLLYTGVTRGKQLVVLVGQQRALAIAVRNQGRAAAGRSCGSGCVSALPLKGATMRALCPARPPTRDPLFTPRRRGPGRAGDRTRLD